LQIPILYAYLVFIYSYIHVLIESTNQSLT